MPNMTITAEGEFRRWARGKAAESDTSVAQLVGDLLRERMRVERGYESARRRFMAVKPRVLSSAPYPTRDELHDRSALR